jgi:hypothetical protein
MLKSLHAQTCPNIVNSTSITITKEMNMHSKQGCDGWAHNMEELIKKGKLNRYIKEDNHWDEGKRRRRDSLKQQSHWSESLRRKRSPRRNDYSTKKMVDSFENMEKDSETLQEVWHLRTKVSNASHIRRRYMRPITSKIRNVF